MPTDGRTIEVVVCMGSACFARGNSENLEILKQKAAMLTHRELRLTGSLCQDQCRRSPNMILNGRMHHGVHREELDQMLAGLNQTPNELRSAPLSPLLREDYGTA